MVEHRQLSCDEEVLEAQNSSFDKKYDISEQDDETAERELDEDLQWTSRKPGGGQKFPPLRVRWRCNLT